MFCTYSCNANVQKKNAAGHSALDLAVAAGDNKVISLLQVSLDREHWTNLRDTGTLFSLVCYYDKPFPQIKLKVLWLWEHLITRIQFCLQNPQPCVISLGPVTVRYFLHDCPVPFQQFRAQFLSDCTLFCKFSFQTKGQTKPSQAQINFNVSEMSIIPHKHFLLEFDTWATALQAVTDDLIFFFDVKTTFSTAHCGKGQALVLQKIE